MKKKENVIKKIQKKIEVSYELADEIVNMLFAFDAKSISISVPDNTKTISL